MTNNGCLYAPNHETFTCQELVSETTNIFMQPLSDIPKGDKIRLAQINGGRKLSRRLLALGISLGNELEVLHQRSSGVVVAKEGNRVALGAGVAEKMLVEKLSD